VDVQEVLPGLWRWTTRHPEWTPEEGGEDGWDEVVASVFYESPSGIVLIDPLVPAGDERARFLRALDRDVERAGRAPSVLLTIYWHERSAAELAARYDGATVWAPARALHRMSIDVTHAFEPGDDLPGGLVAIDSQRGGEVLFWLPGPRTLVSGDVLLGTPEGGLRLLSGSWLPPGVTLEAFSESLRGLLELPVERILPAHGAPILDDAPAALKRALTAAR
jgi:glyoxylase-like metal-dependent hydrolase (beta-lactamase superfamily II)